ncbi:unnamed protein product [Phaeothamnion confervicola]
MDYADLSGCTSLAVWRDAMQRHARRHPELEWVIGVGWDQTLWGGGRLPSRDDLDAAVGADRPSFAYRNCWHIGVASSVALRLAGRRRRACNDKPEVGRGRTETGRDGGESGGDGTGGGATESVAIDIDPDAPGAAVAWACDGGAADADAATGRLTGILRERCIDTVAAAMGEAAPAVRLAQLAAALRRCTAAGLTAVQTNDNGSAWPLYLRLQAEGRLSLRVFLTPDYGEVAAAEMAKEAQQLQGASAETAAANTEMAAPEVSAVGVSKAKTEAAALPRQQVAAAAMAAGKMNSGGAGVEGDAYGDAGAQRWDGGNSGDDSTCQVPAAGSRIGLLSCHRVKLFADGSLGACTAALEEPYVDDNDRSDESGGSSATGTGKWDGSGEDGGGVQRGNDGGEAHGHGPVGCEEVGGGGSTRRGTRMNRGMLIHPPGELAAQIRRAKAWGYRVEVHAIGDRAVAEVLRAMDEAGVVPADRPILTHAQVLSRDLIRGMAQRGIVADIQPSFVPTDAAFVRRRLTLAAQRYAYVWATLMRGTAGADGSDGSGCSASGGGGDRGSGSSGKNPEEDSGSGCTFGVNQSDGDCGGVGNEEAWHVMCAGGSDSPVETLEPMVGMFDAVFRTTRFPQVAAAAAASASAPAPPRSTAENLRLMPDGATVAMAIEVPSGTTGTAGSFRKVPAGAVLAKSVAETAIEPPPPMPTTVFRPEECLTLDEAVWLYTVGAAYAAGEERRLGRIHPGFLADFVVVDPSVEAGGGAHLATSAVREVWVDGIRRWSRTEVEIEAAEKISADATPEAARAALRSSGRTVEAAAAATAEHGGVVGAPAAAAAMVKGPQWYGGAVGGGAVHGKNGPVRCRRCRCCN